MKDLIQQLNNIDVGAWFKKMTSPQSSRSAGVDGSLGQASPLKATIDRIFYKVDKKLFITIGLALLLIIWGISSVFDSLSKRGEVSELELSLSQLESENATLVQQLATLKANNKTLFETTKNAPNSANELLSRISDIYGRAGMAVLKVSTGTADKPEFIQIDAEGAFRSIQFVLAELLKLSPVIDLKSLQFSSDSNKGLLQMSIGMQFVKSPKISASNGQSENDYAYLDGSNHQLSSSHIRRIQFVPQNPSGNKSTPAAAAPAPGSAPVAAAPVAPSNPPSAGSSGGNALDRNPFYIPANPSAPGGAVSQSSPGAGVDFGRSMGSSPSPVRGDGIYVTGCMVSKGKKACLFQLTDGSTGVYSVGQSIGRDLKLTDIQADVVTLQISGKVRKVKVGEQVQ
jgi:hypothetical protein